MLKLIRYIRTLLMKITDDHVSAYAAQSAYFLILSSAPFVLFLLTLLRFIPLNADELLDAARLVFPSLYGNYYSVIISGIRAVSQPSTTSTTLLSITTVVVLWTAGKGILALTRGLNSVYNCIERRGYLYLRLISTLYTLIFAVILVFTLIALVYGNSIYQFISGVFPALMYYTSLVKMLRMLVSISIFTLMFMFFYKVLPSKKPKTLHVIPGAFFTTAGWIIASYVFSIYVEYSKNLSYIYSGLTNIMSLLLWLYLIMYIFFLGGELNVFLFPDEKESTESDLKY